MIGRLKGKWAGLVFAAVLLVGAPGAVMAQSGPGGPPPGPGFRGMGPDEALGFVGFEGGFSSKSM